MLVFKLSWLPYMFIIAGIALAAEGQPSALILCVIGGGWLYLKFKNKKAENNTNNANPSGAPYITTNVPQAAPVASKSAPLTDANNGVVKFCSNCGTKINPGSVFCNHCGKKL